MTRIYLITNILNNKIYIGKTTKTVEKRWIEHKSSARMNVDTYLYKAIRKHGENNFTIKELNFTADCFGSWLEKIYIEKYKSYLPDIGYNLTLGGEGVVANKETREKISNSLKEYYRINGPDMNALNMAWEAKKKIPPPNLGLVMPQETKDKISRSKKENPTKYWLGKKFSKEHCENMSIVRFRTDIPDNEVKELYLSGLSAGKIADKYNTSKATICWRLNRLNVTMRPVGWQKKNKEQIQ